jgi:hypothetical protein
MKTITFIKPFKLVNKIQHRSNQYTYRWKKSNKILKTTFGSQQNTKLIG